MKNFFFILFIIACITYGYGSIQNFQLLKQIGLYTATPFLFMHYLVNTQKVELIYILMLLFTFLGDNSFHLHSNGIAREALTIVAFIFVSSFFTMLILERKQFTGMRKIILTSLLIGIFFLIINYTLFKDTKQVLYAVAVYFVSLSILCATSISFYIKTKTKESLFFLIGSIGLFFASIAKSYEYLEKTPLSIMLNILFYIISNLYFVKAVLIKHKRTEKLI